MANVDRRDFFISFNSADLDYAEALDAALRAEGFTTFYHPRDLGPGGNIPIWMDDALMNSAQTLALYSPDYTNDKAVYSKAERYASWWQDPLGGKRKLIPILLRETTFTPLIAMISRIEVKGLPPKEAATRIVKGLMGDAETKERDASRAGLAAPQVFYAAYRPNPNFTGRFEALDSLQRSLRTGTNAAVTAVAGMGGVGKTTLAAEYCHRLGGRYGGVWWVRAEQESVMLADLQALGQRLGLVSGKNIETDARACLDHLATLSQPWLMVYDNAPNPDAISKWLPVGAVRCIITSRFTEFGAIAPVTRLDQWSPEVTANYLLSRTGRDDAAGAARLARTLGGLPLAAEQAAVYLSPRVGVSFDDYAADIAALIKRPRPQGAKGDYPDTVYAAFVKSLETLSGEETGGVALNVLCLCAFLSPDGVDLGLLTLKWDREVLPAPLAVAIANKSVREDALAALGSLSLMRREIGPAGPSLVFHRLLMEVVRDWMGAEARELWGGAATQLVSSVFPDSDRPAQDTSVWSLCARLTPHVAPLNAYAPRKGSAARALDFLLNQASLYLTVRGDSAGALALLEQSVMLARLTRAEDPLGLAASLSNLGGRYADLDRLEEAEKTYREALQIYEPLADPNDPNLAIILSNLAEVHTKRKQFDQAEPLLLRVVEVMKVAYSPESAEYGIALGNLGSLYALWADSTAEAARRAQEEKYKLQALIVIRGAYGERHPQTSLQRGNLAVMSAKSGNWTGAAAEASRAIAIMLSLDLARHPSAIGRMADLAHFWHELGHLERVARLRTGDISDLLPIITQIETEHRAWVAKDPKNRNFGPPSPFGPSEAEIEQALIDAGVDLDDLERRIQSGELSDEDVLNIIKKHLVRQGS